MRLILLTAVLSLSLFGNAANYYLSSSTGDDSRTSAEAQIAGTPWRSLQRLNAFSSQLQPGDTVFFKRGDVFEGRFSLAKSGAQGNPIVFTAYGQGARPVISGLTSLADFRRFSGNIWVQNLTATRPAILLLNETQQPYGRFPNTDFLKIESHENNSAIYDKDLRKDVDWTGGEVVIRKNRWIIDRSPIVDHVGQQLVYTATSQYIPNDGFGYFIQNHLKTLDREGEWSYDARQKKLYLYSTGYSPAYNVKLSVVDTLFSINNQSHVELYELQFKGANETLLHVTYARNIAITNCDFLYAGLNAMFFNYVSSVVIENSTFNYNNSNAITTLYGCRNFRIRNNVFTNTGIFPGMGKSGDLSYQAITIKGKNNLVEYNQIEKTGYVPIRFEGDSLMIRNNFISNFCFLKDDGAGIYTWNNDSRAVDNLHRLVKDNIVLNGIGAGEGTTKPNELYAHGIYLDDNAANVEITGNTVANCSAGGIYIHNGRNSVVRDNTLYNNERQLHLQHDNVSPNAPVRNVEVKNNILYAKTASQMLVHMRSIKDDIANFGTSDSNYYNRPFNTEPFTYTAYTRNYNEFVQAYDLSTWQGAMQKDRNSKTAPIQFQKYKRTGTLGANRVTNATFDHNIYSVYGHYYAGAFNLEWNGGKLDGGCLQATFNMATNNRAYIIMDVGSVTAGKTYVLRFSQLGTSTNKSLSVFLRKTTAPYSRIAERSYCKVLNQRTENEVMFVPTETVSGASIVLDISDQNTLWFDNFRFQEATVSMLNPNDYLRFDYNATRSRKSITLDGSYVDGRNQAYSGTFDLEPFTSVVLFRTQATAKADQAISFPPVAAKVYGDRPFDLAATATSGLPVSYRVVAGPAIVSGNTVTISGAGTVTIEASQAGNASFNAAVPASQNILVDKGTQTISFANITTKTYGDPAFSLSATASSGLPVDFRVLSGPATLSGKTLTVNGAGMVAIEATQAGDDNYKSAPASIQSFRVTKASQTISFDAPGNKKNSDEPFTLNATATSGLPVNFRVVSGPAAINGVVVTLTGTGEVSIEASQLGNENYNAAGAVLRSFTVTEKEVQKSDQLITFSAIGDKIVGDAPIVLSAFATSGLPVNFRVLSGPATVSNGVLTLTGAGTVVIEATQPGDSGYHAASPVTQSFNIAIAENGKTNQFINFGTLAYQTYNSPPFAISATASSGLTVRFRVVAGPVTVSNDNMVTITGVGFATIEAMQEGDDSFNPAAPVQRRFMVGKGNQSLTFSNLANKSLGDAPFALDAASSSGLPVSYRVISGPAAVNGNIVTLAGAGPVTIEAWQPGDALYNASFVLTRSFVVVSNGQVKAAQSINFPAIANKTFGDPSFALMATATSGLPVSYQVVSGPAKMSDDAVYITGAGVITIEATQSGSGSYNAAEPVRQSFTVDRASQAINIGTLPYQPYSPQPFTISASATSGLPVLYRLVSGPVTISGNTVTMTGTGFVIVEAYQPGDDNYTAATPVQRGFTIGKAGQIIAFTLPTFKTTDEKPFALTAASTSGLPVSYRVVFGPATITDNMVSLSGPGIVVIEASQPGDANFLPAFPLMRSFLVTPPGRFAGLDAVTTGDPQADPEAQAFLTRQKPGTVMPEAAINLISLYPNPATAAATINLSVAKTGEGTVEVHDIRGRLVKRVASRNFEKGERVSLSLDAGALHSGTYFISLRVKDAVVTQKFQVIR